MTQLTRVLRSLGHFSHTAIISRHETYRQSYTAIISPTSRSLTPSSSARNTTGTTVSVKDLFANFPVRQALARSNRQSQWTEILKVTVGVGLTTPVGVSVRTCAGEKVVRIERSSKNEWERNVIEKGWGCTLSGWTNYEERDDHVHLSLKLCQANTPRNSSFICSLPRARIY